MGFDRNTVIGFVLLMILLFGYIFMAQRGQYAAQKEKQRIADSIAKSQPQKVDTSIVRKDTAGTAVRAVIDTAAGEFGKTALSGEELAEVENDLMKVTFSNRGGMIKQIELKDFKKFDGTPVILGGEGHQFSYRINSGPNQTSLTGDLSFELRQSEEGGIKVISYVLNGKNGESIEHEYRIRPDDYMIDLNVHISDANRLFSGKTIDLNWVILAHQQEREHKYETAQSQITLTSNGDWDYYSVPRSNSKKLEEPVSWIGIKQQFFSTVLLAKNNFSNPEFSWEAKSDSSGQIASFTSDLKINTDGNNVLNIPMQFYFGPNEYRIMKSYHAGLENNVQLGYGIFSFVKYINRWFIMPVFHFFAKYIGSFGLVILLLTVIIRLLISPLTYSSYLSGAKMKVLRPEIAALKEKYGKDQQAFGMEQMKLFREAGVNPLGGCIPALFQIPIFFALYSFFNSNIDLRGESFLWATNLASYDSVAKLPFTIPFYGDHVSMFTITATATSFLISVYSMMSTPQQDNPMMKYMPYIFPVMLLFIFNSLPSALTWYYTVSNLITLAIQFVIQRFIIDHDKIHAQIQENKKKPKVKTKWQQRMEQMQESQKKLQQMKTQPKKK